jgi:hypothetical protein
MWIPITRSVYTRNSDCGTGAGGFKKGNTCAGGENVLKAAQESKTKTGEVRAKETEGEVRRIGRSQPLAEANETSMGVQRTGSNLWTNLKRGRKIVYDQIADWEITQGGRPGPGSGEPDPSGSYDVVSYNLDDGYSRLKNAHDREERRKIHTELLGHHSDMLEILSLLGPNKKLTKYRRDHEFMANLHRDAVEELS